MTERRIVISGIGIVSPCGIGWQNYWQAVLEGRSAIRSIANWNLNGFPSKYAGQLENFNPAQFIKNRKGLKVMSREMQLALAASNLALEDSAINLPDVNLFRFGVSLGAGIINNDLDEVGTGIRNSIDENGVFQITKFGQEGIRSMFPLWFLKYLPNMPACHISISHGLKGPSNTITTSAAAGAQAIGEAFQVIKRGDADLMLAGGADSKVNPMGISRFHLLGLLSSRNGIDAEKIYCPFDRNSDGLILGEGAGLLLLEEREHALKRGAKIYGEILGYGASSDMNYDLMQTEDVASKTMAISRALSDAAIDANDIDFLVANGSGVPREDYQEAQAFHKVFPRISKTPVTAVKPITGHAVYGAGGIELASGLLALKEQVLPPVMNLEEPDPIYNLSFVQGKPKPCETSHFLINAFGFGGQNATLVVRK